ncbi:AraC family transcriptional regulator [Pseudoneobacillus sp. C159]
MPYIHSIQKAIDYIEENIHNDISLEKVASHAGYSLYHFHRIFTSIMGCSIKTYIRRRRLTCAAYDLNQTNKRIIDIAYEYQFESQESFTRSFQQLFGVTPGKYRNNKPYLEFVGPHEILDIFDKELDVANLNPRIEKRDSFYVIGMEKQQLEIAGSANRNKTIQHDIPSLWESFLLNMDQIQGKTDSRITYGIGRPTGGGIHFSYMACMEVHSGNTPIPTGMIGSEVPGGTYAVFTYYGNSQNIPKLANYIYGSWLPTTTYRLNFGVEMEVYNESWKKSESDEIGVEIWVPIHEIESPVE